MILEAVPHRFSVVDRLDPRVRVVGGIGASLFPLFLHTWTGQLLTLGVAMSVVVYERVPVGGVARRLVAVNAFMATLVILLPWSVPGTTLLGLGPLAYTREGLAQALSIALKGNSVVLILTTFLGTMEPLTFAHALERLRVPSRLVVLLMFTVRYIAVFEREYGRLRQAMRSRAFRPRLNRHTLRTFGYLVGMLLVRAMERSERIQQAMKCRGFTGRFHTHRHMRVGRADWAFGATLLVLLTALSVSEWL